MLYCDEEESFRSYLFPAIGIFWKSTDLKKSLVVEMATFYESIFTAKW